MSESFDAFEYVTFLSSRWRVVAIATFPAVLLALGGSLLMEKRYTATASIVIEPPGSNDVRTSTAVSPVYLESLRTYERFAASDSLFQRAVDRFKLQDAEHSQSIEGLKRRVLKVSKLRDTKILEIAVTLPQPKVAQNLVEYLAKETVAMSREESLASDREQIVDLEKQAAEAQTRLDAVRAKWSKMAATDPTAGLQAGLEANTELLAKTRQEWMAAESDMAAYQDQVTEEFARRELATSRAKAAFLERRTKELERAISTASATLAQSSAQREASQMDLKAAQIVYDSASSRLRDQRALLGMRGERLRVMDPGIVPERPSSPNIPLNVLTALLAAFVASVIYVSFAFAMRRRSVRVEEDRPRMVASR